MLLEFAEGDDAAPALTPEQIEGVKRALEQARRGEFASDESVKDLLGRPWA